MGHNDGVDKNDFTKKLFTNSGARFYLNEHGIYGSHLSPESRTCIKDAAKIAANEWAIQEAQERETTRIVIGSVLGLVIFLALIGAIIYAARKRLNTTSGETRSLLPTEKKSETTGNFNFPTGVNKVRTLFGIPDEAITKAEKMKTKYGTQL